MSTSLMQYLDKAIGALDELGLLPANQEEAPIVALISRIQELEPETSP